MSSGYIGVDLDGTLAEYDGWRGADHIGRPIGPMVDRVKKWLAEGKRVKIFTARVYAKPGDRTRLAEADAARQAISDWCMDVFGKRLDITCVKDLGMTEIWDDRAVQVIRNKGIPVGYDANSR